MLSWDTCCSTIKKSKGWEKPSKRKRVKYFKKKKKGRGVGGPKILMSRYQKCRNGSGRSTGREHICPDYLLYHRETQWDTIQFWLNRHLRWGRYTLINPFWMVIGRDNQAASCTENSCSEVTRTNIQMRKPVEKLRMMRKKMVMKQ